MRSVHKLASLMVLALLVTVVHASPDREATDIGVKAESLLLDGRYDDLESMATDYRNPNQRTTGGNAKLYHFYGALGAYRSSQSYGYESEVSREAKRRCLLEWQAKRPKSVAARIAVAEHWSIFAWTERGGSYSNSVGPEQWEKFREGLRLQSAALDGVPTDIDPHVRYLQISAAQGESSRKLVDTLYSLAVAVHPAYFHYYSQRADLLQSKWFGKPGELTAYIESVLQTPGGNNGLVAYSYIASMLLRTISSGDLFKPEVGFDWPTLKNAYKVRENQYGLRNRDWNALLNLAVAARDRGSALDALDRIGNDWNSAVWSERRYFEQAAAWARKR